MHLNFSNQIRINHATSKSFNTFVIHPDPDDLRVLLLGGWQVCVDTLIVALRNSSCAHLLRILFRRFPRLQITISSRSFLHMDNFKKEKSFAFALSLTLALVLEDGVADLPGVGSRGLFLVPTLLPSEVLAAPSIS
jgi:hypothetical protein